MATSSADKLLFRLADAADVALFGVRPTPGRVLPRGRAILAPSGLEAQLAAASDADLSDACGRWAGSAGRARPIDVLPAEVPLSAVAGAVRIGDHDWFLPVGVGDDDLGPIGLRLCAGDAALVAGPPRSGRSSALAAVATLVAASAARVAITAVALRRSPLRDLCDGAVVTEATALGDALDRIVDSPVEQLLLIDDAESVDDPSGRLARLLAERPPHVRLLVAGRSDMLRAGYGHWTAAVRRNRIGIVLRPQPDVDAELWQISLPRRPVSLPAGRGYLVADGAVELVQLASCEPTRGHAPCPD